MRINNNDDVLVAYRSDTTGTWGAKVYHWAQDQWEIVDLDVVVDSSYLQMNDFMQVTVKTPTGAFRWDPPTETAPNGTLVPIGPIGATGAGINNLGTVCGTIYAKPAKGPANNYPFRFTTSLEVLFGQSGYGHAINSDSDLFVRTGDGTKNFVYQSTLGKFYDVDTLIDPNDPNAATWFNNVPSAVDMNDRGTNGFGQLTGRMHSAVNGAVWGAYLLTPQ